MNPNFDVSTRLKFVPMAAQSRPVGGGTVNFELPKTGILAGIMLVIRGAVAGTLSAPNALGMASIIRRVTLRANAGQAVIDISGAGYHYLLRDFLNDNGTFGSYTNARAAVTATTYILDMYLPIAKDLRDQMGLISLQNQTTLLSLQVDYELDATVATGATVTGTVTPTLVMFEIPSDAKNWPTFDTLHQCIEEQSAIPSTADYRHNIAIGGVLLGEYSLIPAGFTRAELRVQETNLIASLVPFNHQIAYDMVAARDLTLVGALTGVDKRLLWDFCGTDGMGQFGSLRDIIDTSQLSSIFELITPVGATTMLSVRRQIMNVS